MFWCKTDATINDLKVHHGWIDIYRWFGVVPVPGGITHFSGGIARPWQPQSAGNCPTDTDHHPVAKTGG
ncbi:hypothetical protein D3C76_1612490 [compost metagenome]